MARIYYFIFFRDEDFMPPCCVKKTYECCPYALYRTYDGSCNNLENPDWGVPNSTYSRLLPAHYGNGIQLIHNYYELYSEMFQIDSNFIMFQINILIYQNQNRQNVKLIQNENIEIFF